MKEKTADEMFENLGYKKRNLDIIFSRFLEEWENEDLAKTFSFNTEYETIDIIDENRYGITMQELQVINKKCKELRLDMIETETGKVLNKLAREQFKSKLLAEILMDLQVCKLENLNSKEYIEELKQEIDNIYERFNNKNE